MNTQQLRAEIVALQDATMDGNKNFRTAYDEGKFDALTEVNNLLDSMQEVPVSEELEEAAMQYAKLRHKDATLQKIVSWDFKAGAQWQLEHIKEALLSEVLPCFMHGGEADEVVAKLDEVLNFQKK